MSRVLIREGRWQDAIDLAPRLRPADLLEMKLSSGPDIETTLLKSVALSDECWAGEEDGQLIALGGVAPFPGLPGCGAPWLVASEEAVRRPIQLVKAGREYAARWGEKYPLLLNYVHAENAVHIAWLKRVGFTFGDTLPDYGIGKAPFTLFYRYSNV